VLRMVHYLALVKLVSFKKMFNIHPTAMYLPINWIKFLVNNKLASINKQPTIHRAVQLKDNNFKLILKLLNNKVLDLLKMFNIKMLLNMVSMLNSLINEFFSLVSCSFSFHLTLQCLSFSFISF